MSVGAEGLEPVTNRPRDYVTTSASADIYDQPVEIAKLVLDYVNALKWPAFALIIVIAFKAQVRSFLADLEEFELPGGARARRHVGDLLAAELKAEVAAIEPGAPSAGGTKPEPASAGELEGDLVIEAPSATATAKGVVPEVRVVRPQIKYEMDRREMKRRIEMVLNSTAVLHAMWRLPLMKPAVRVRIVRDTLWRAINLLTGRLLVDQEFKLVAAVPKEISDVVADLDSFGTRVEKGTLTVSKRGANDYAESVDSVLHDLARWATTLLGPDAELPSPTGTQ